MFFNKYIGYDNIRILNNDREFGNGVNQEMVRRILAMDDVKLVITMDHGSFDHDRYKILKEHGIDIIVTDHHLVGDTGSPTNVDAFINPQRDGGNFNTYISGCTVGFYLYLKTRELLLEQDYPFKKDDELKLLLPYVALTIITDQMNLLDKVNRSLYKEGIRCMDLKQGIWYQVTKQLNLSKTFSTMSINFGMGPLFNAAGRMGNAKLATDAQIADNPRDQHMFVKELIKNNNDRKALQNKLLGKANLQLKNYIKRFKNTLVVILDDGLGVSGIIAGVLGDKYNRPIFSFTKMGDHLHGSARGILKDFNIKGVIDYCKSNYPDIKINGGGHKGAAGCRLPYADIMKFITAFEEYTLKQEQKPDDVKYYNIAIKLKELNIELFREIYTLDPFGMNFRPPVIKTRGIIDKLMYIGKNKEHVVVKINDREIIFFSVGDMFKNIQANDMVDILLTISLKNNYRDGKEILSSVGSDIEKVV